MSDEFQNPMPGDEPVAALQFARPRRWWQRAWRPQPWRPRSRSRRPRAKTGDKPPTPRLRKLRFVLILIGLATLALISTIFGMMMAVASDLPQLENKQQYHKAANSFLYDDHWHAIGIFAPPNHVVVDQYNDISSSMKDAIIAIEDKRFLSDPGVDIRGIARAFIADVFGGQRQGASTIAQQFVKNALSEQNNRTVFEKLREAALAYHLTRKWSKEKILTEYLNSIYFGNGAYGVESAARVYFGKAHGFDSAATSNQTGQTAGCGDSTPEVQRPKCASELAPWEAALLAGMVANPTGFDPVAHPQAANDRRTLVLKDMLEQHYITQAQYDQGIAEPIPTQNDIQQPSEPTAAPYFTSWLRPQILAAMGLGHRVPASVADYRAYYGGLKIRTTLDLSMQQAAEQAISSNLPAGSGLPTASLVAIDNKTGEVRAMIGGQDYAHSPFNLATEGHRQPGSAFKPFTLATALESGEYSPDSIINSAPQDFIVPNSAGKEHFIVHNFGNTYSGPISLASATTISDNSVYAQVGIHVGPARVARTARRMGIRSPVSHNYAMILGGLRVGVTPLDMAHAYETFATGGRRVFNPQLGAPDGGPTGIAQIQCPANVCGGSSENIVDRPTYVRVMPASVAQTVHDILTTVVQSGTGTQAAISGVDVAGKTGTTTNYGDAWFVGWTPQLTTAVWVGFPNSLVSMATDYNGQPVEGGTYPAIIWQNFMSQALQILANEQAQNGASSSTTSTATLGSASSGTGTGAGPSGTTPTTAAGSAGHGAGGTGASGGNTGGSAGGGGATGGGGGATGGGGGATGGGGGATGGGGGTGSNGGGGSPGTSGSGAGSGGAGVGGR
jgi:penicillin-binding protein 1A